MKITEKDFPRLHKELWIWCSKNPEKKKSEWPEWRKGDLFRTIDYCFACEYANKHNDFCPLLGGICLNGYIRVVFKCLKGLYRDWQIAGEDKDYKKRSEIALVIANLPWQEEEK